MSDRREKSSPGTRQASQAGPRSEPDLTVPDFEVGSEHSALSAPQSDTPATARQVFSGGQWFLLWLVITLGIAGGNLLSNLITTLTMDAGFATASAEVNAKADKASGAAGKALEEAAERPQGKAQEQSTGDNEA